MHQDVLLVSSSADSAATLARDLTDVRLATPADLAAALAEPVQLVLISGVDRDTLPEVVARVLEAAAGVPIAVDLSDTVGESLRLTDASPLRGLTLVSASTISGAACAVLARAESADTVPDLARIDIASLTSSGTPAPRPHGGCSGP